MKMEDGKSSNFDLLFKQVSLMDKQELQTKRDQLAKDKEAFARMRSELNQARQMVAPVKPLMKVNAESGLEPAEKIAAMRAVLFGR